MNNSKDSEIDFGEIYSSANKDFNQREEEKEIINVQIQNLVGMIAKSEPKLNELSVFGATEQLHLAKAKVELINILKLIEDGANTRLENNFRAGKEFIESEKDKG